MSSGQGCGISESALPLPLPLPIFSLIAIPHIESEAVHRFDNPACEFVMSVTVTLSVCESSEQQTLKCCVRISTMSRTMSGRWLTTKRIQSLRAKWCESETTTSTPFFRCLSNQRKLFQHMMPITVEPEQKIYTLGGIYSAWSDVKTTHSRWGRVAQCKYETNQSAWIMACPVGSLNVDTTRHFFIFFERRRARATILTTVKPHLSAPGFNNQISMESITIWLDELQLFRCWKMPPSKQLCLMAKISGTLKKRLTGV